MAKARSKPKKHPAAQASGFSRQLRAAFDQNIRAAAKGFDIGPTSPESLAEWMTDRGTSVAPRTAAYWLSGTSLPVARYVALLEEALGAPWTWLHDPTRPDVSLKKRLGFVAEWSPDPVRRERARALLERGPGVDREQPA